MCSPPLCISLIEGKSPSRSEHLCGKTAKNGTFLRYDDCFTQKDALQSSYSLLEILKYLCTTKCFKKVSKVAVLRSIIYMFRFWTKCTVISKLLLAPSVFKLVNHSRHSQMVMMLQSTN